MWCVREHVHWLYLSDTILFVHQLKVASLSGRVTTDIDDALRGCMEYSLHYVGVHASTGRVSDNHIGMSVLSNELFCQNILHVASIEQSVANLVHFRVDLASSIASGTYSIPITLRAFLATKLAMVPVPV